MNSPTPTDLRQKSCQPCEGGMAPLPRVEAERLLESLDGWELEGSEATIRRRWKVKDFMAGIAFLDRVAEVAEAEGHHPDIHLTGYRHVTIELTTHAINGLSENDFILAAKIDDLDVELHQPSS